MPVGFHKLGEPYGVAAKPFLHQCLEVGPALEPLFMEDVSDIVVTASARRKLVVHGVVAGTAKNILEPKRLRCIFGRTP